jgi:hypothetical protein
VYTISLTKHKTPVEFRMYKDPKTGYEYNLAWFAQGKYILNYWPYEIVNTKQVEEKQLQLLYQYSSIDLQLEKY